jgi:hypothetical protein
VRVGVGGERTARASVVHLTHVRARAKTAVFAPSFLTDANWVVVACDTRVFAWRACVHLWPATLPCTGGQAEAAETRSYAERFPPYQPVSLKNDKGIGSLRKKAGDIDRDPKGVYLCCLYLFAGLPLCALLLFVSVPSFLLSVWRVLSRGVCVLVTAPTLATWLLRCIAASLLPHSHAQAKRGN